MRVFTNDYLIRLRLLPLLAIAAAITFPVPASGQASFQGLGDLPGGSFYSFAFGVSADGNTVVGYSSRSSQDYEAFRWNPSQNPPMQGLGVLPGGSSFLSQAYSVSADGNTVVGYSRSSQGNEAFRWNPSQNPPMQGLGDLPGSPFASIARGVSASGNAVVGEGSVARLGAFNTVTRAFISWSPNFLALQNLGDLSGGPSEGDSLAYAVSADGSVVVGEGSSSFGREAFVWRAPAGMVGLGDLTSGSFFSQALGVSADGNTVVGRGTSASGGEAFRWTAASGMVGLGDLLGGRFLSVAYGVSADGNTVVGRSSSSQGDEAFIWDSTSGNMQPPQSLRDVLINDYGLSQVAGWRLFEARAISDDGRVIVGYGRNPQGSYEAWRAVLGPSNAGPTVTCPVSVSEECVAGGADVLLEAEVFDADGDNLDVQWVITFPDLSTQVINDVVSFGEPPLPTTVALGVAMGGGAFHFPLGASSVSVSVGDGIADNAACSPITVTVEDTTDPIILTLMEVVEVGTDPGECFATVDLDSNNSPYHPVFSDLCSTNVSTQHNAPATFPIGETIVTWSVDDGNGNMIEVLQRVVVSDQEAPTASPPADVVIGHDAGTCEATAVDLGLPTADDNCGVTSMTNDAVEPFPLGDTEVTWYISDAAGNMIMVTQTVTVTNADPIANAGPDQVLECNSNSGQVVTLNGTTSSDPDVGDILSYHWDAVDITFDDPDSATPTATFFHGSTTVQLTVEDQCGGVSTTDLLIIIEDTTAPQIQAALVDQQVLWPPNHNMIPIALDLLVSDLCTAPEDLLLSCTVTSSEDDDEQGDGSFTGDVDGQDGYAQEVPVTLSYNATTGRWEGLLQLRAERAGGGNGRKYSIRCLAMDESSNVTSATVCVTVPKSRGGGGGNNN